MRLHLHLKGFDQLDEFGRLFYSRLIEHIWELSREKSIDILAAGQLVSLDSLKTQLLRSDGPFRQIINYCQGWISSKEKDIHIYLVKRSRSGGRFLFVTHLSEEAKKNPAIPGIFLSLMPESNSGFQAGVVPFPPIPGPVNSLGAVQFKNKYSPNVAFMLLCCRWLSEKQIISVLQAFSAFKKRQKTGMKLGLADLVYPPAIQKRLRNYKYRGDVFLMEAGESAEAVASSYACISPFIHDQEKFLLTQLLFWRIPFISSSKTQSIDVISEFSCDFDDHLSIANAMMRMYTDEDLRAGSVVARRDMIDETATLRQIRELLSNLI